MSKEIVERLYELEIGLPDGRVLCDFCNRKLANGEEVRVLYSKLDISEEEYKLWLETMRRKFRADRVIAPSTTEDIYVSCLDCLGDSLEKPTLGTDEWIFKAVLGKTRLRRIEKIYHSPPEEGT